MLNLFYQTRFMKACKIISILLFFQLGLSFFASAQLVYKTPSGAKYHLASCHMVKNASTKISLSEARGMGLEPCKICKPATLPGAPSNKPAQGESNTVQCKGQTKAGARCKHMTSIGNGYCYQHQPD